MKNKKNYLYLFLLVFCCLPMLSNSQNPFELEHRLEEGDVEVNTLINSNNPFEKRTTVVDTAFTTVAPIKEEKVKPLIHRPVQKIEANSSAQFKFWIMIISLVLLTVLFVLYKSLVSKAYRGFLNENFLKMIHRNEGRIVSVPYLLLYALYFISSSTFLYLISEHLGWILYAEPVKQYFVCLAIIGLVFLIKHMVLLLMSFVFPISKDIRQYSFTIVVFNIILGILLLPFNLFIAFAAPPLAQGIIYLALALILVFYVYRSFRGLLIAASYLATNKFHFFMYLCAVEIAPVLLLAAFLNGSGATH